MERRPSRDDGQGEFDPPRLRNPMMEGLGADSEEKHVPATPAGHGAGKTLIRINQIEVLRVYFVD